MKKAIVLILFLLIALLGKAQIYPVQVTPQLVPPYSFRLSDYQTTTLEKLFVNLLLTDAQDAGRQVRLRMYIQGQGLDIRTTDFVAGAAPIFLDGGINQRLSNLDLRPYFALQNLLGISPYRYGQLLPEGRLALCFEVFDFISGQPLSRRSCTSVYLQLNEPPLLNFPGRGELVNAREPQNIVFNWTPRHINAPAVQYEFTLKELWDTGMDPQAAFLASPPLHQTTTYATTLLYGPADTPLLVGKTYGWQVRAFSDNGFEQTAQFRNNGLSEIYHFEYQSDCPPPRYVISEARDSRTVEVRWQDSPEHMAYRVEYRKKGYGETDWFGTWTQDNSATLRNLEGGTVYEFRVGGECAPNTGAAFSEVHELTTPTEEEMAYYNCGIPPEVEITNREPLQNLGVNHVFTAGDFPVTVKTVIDHGGGYYSGWGFIVLPYLADTRVRVEFENIKVNTDHQMVEGMVVTSYDAEWENIVDLDQVIDAIGDLFDDLFGQKEELLDQLSQTQDQGQRQDIISQINDVEVTIAQQIDAIPSKDKLPKELQDELEDLKQAGNLAATSELSPQEIADIKAADSGRRERIKEIAEMAEDELFYTGASAYLLGRTDYINGIKLIQELFEHLENVYDDCWDQGLKSYQGQGVVPYCLWKDSNVAPPIYYGALDPSFMAGVVDGLYQEVEGLVLLPKYLLDLKKAQYDLIYAYTASFLQCPADLPKFNEERARELYRRMERERPDNLFGEVLSFLDTVKDYVSDYQDQRCEDALKLRQEVSDLLEFLKERENLQKLFAEVEKKLKDYWETIYDLDNQARYQHGKIIVAALTFLVPTGITQLSKLGRLKKVLETLHSYTRAQMDEFLIKFRKFMDGKVAKGVVKNVDEVKHLLKTEPNTAFFWSGRTSKGIGVEAQAAQIARSRNGTTLETLLKEKDINMPAWDASDPSVVKIWEDISGSYANQVSGEVRAVIGKNLRQGNVWENIELPRLKSNPNVTKITTIDPETMIETIIFTRKL